MSTLHDSSAGAEAPTQPHPTVRSSRGGNGAPPPPPRNGGRQARRAAAEAARKAELRRRRKWIRRGVALVFVALLVPAVASYYSAISAPGTDPVSIRSVEWLKDNGMTGVVNTIEHWWYTHHAPAVGGKPKGGLPKSAGTSGSAATKKGAAAIPAHLPPPAAMQPLVTTPLPGEGLWTPTGRTVQGLPGVYTTFFRPDAVHTSLVAGAMWMDTTLLRTELVPGLQEPGGPNPYGGQIPPEQRAAVVAAFNSGFKLSDSGGGYYNYGHEFRPLVNGVASLVIDTQGKASVGAWGRDFVMSPFIQTVRQNLSLLVDGGQLVPGLASDANTKWGATVGNNTFVWRSGVGVDANGGLIYVGGNGINVASLATILQRAGAVRAMELDINSAWVSAFTYHQAPGLDPSVIHGTKLLPDMTRPEDRYLVPGERDFFALLPH
jgi:Phosphodiester glycosidase